MLRVRLLGGLRLELDGRPVTAPSGRPARALLAWLALHPGRHPRSAVASALWPDVLDSSARASLRTALSALRSALGDGADGVLVADRQAVGLEGVWADALEFESLLHAGRPADALELGSGELLPDLDDDWVLAERDRHRDRRGDALAALAGAADNPQAALGWARSRAELDPFDEPAQRDLIARLADSGDRAGALAAYERFAERLRRELAVAPAAATRELVESLRAQAPAAAVPLPPRLEASRWRTSFVGRSHALARLGASWAAVQRGGIGFALVVGEPGIGKTRLAARFAAEVHAGGAAVLAGRAEPDGAEPYEPVAGALRAAGRLPAAASSSDDRAGRVRLQEALAEALERAAGGRSLLLVLDDLHWADAATLALLRRVAARGLGVPALLLVTSRPGELDPGRPFARAVAEIARDLPLTRVELQGLSLDETAALVAERAAGEDADVRALAARTGGNPFFLEALVDAGLTGTGGELPAGVADLVTARVAWLGSPVGELLQAAAVLGREFDVELAAALAQLADDEALAAIDSAAEAQLVVRSGVRMAFVHALVQEALERALKPSALLQLHARAAHALESRGQDEAAARHALAAVPVVEAERAAALAERAGATLIGAFAPDDAAELLTRAVEVCDQAGAAAAVRMRIRCALGEALDAADRHDEARTAFEDAAALARRAGDGALLGRAALGSAGPAVAIVRVDRERVATLGEALAALPAAEHGLRSRLQARLAIELAYSPEQERRQRLSAEALEAARQTRDPQTLAAALGARHVVLWGPDDTRERLALADEMVDVARRAGDPALELQGRTWRIVDLDELGEGAAVEEELDAYAATAARSRLSVYGWYVPAWRGVRALHRGSLDEGRMLLRHAIELGCSAGDPNAYFATRMEYAVALADDRIEELDLAWQEERVRNSPAGWAYRAMYTWGLAAGGREADARHELAAQRAQGAPGSWPRDTNWLSALKELSEAAFVLGEQGLGAEIAELLDPFRDRNVTSARSFMSMGSVCGALGRLAQLAGDHDRAALLYEEAVERDERAGSLIWAVHHRLRLAEALLDSGRHERGLGLLARVEAEGPPMGLARLAELARERRGRE